MVANEKWFGGAGATAGFYSYQIENSVLFNEDASDSMTRTPSSAGNSRTWTWSCWIKRTVITHSGNHMVIWGADSGESSSYWQARFTNADNFVINGNGGTEVAYSQVHRDVGGWGHFMIAYDTTQSTASNRVKSYFNGTQITDTSYNSIPSQNFDTTVNSTTEHQIGILKYGGSSSDFASYLADFIIIDGTALTPSSFLETKNGVVIPKDPSGLTFGTNGVWLRFKNASNLGQDYSGQSNNWTVTNMSADRQKIDVPTFGS